MTIEELESLVPFETDVLFHDEEWGETIECQLDYIDGDSVIFVSGGGFIGAPMENVLSDMFRLK